MTPQETEIIRSAIQQKLELLNTMATQMEPHISAGTLSAETLQKFQIAREAYDVAWLKLEEGKLEDCVYFLLRGGWNTGEFLAMSRSDRAGRGEVSSKP